MSAKKGSLVLIKIGDGGSPEVFESIGGLRTSRMQINNQALESTNLESGHWKQLLAGAGIKSLTLSGNGIFVDSTAEETLRISAFSSSVKNYRFYFANGDYLAGAFYISAYERSGVHDDVEIYAVTMSSAGTIQFTGA